MSEPTPDGYRLLRTLGFGGEGWVALAVQESVGREVAVKTLYAADSTALARFRREGQALARVASDRIVRVYDLVEHGDRVALVLEYVPGGSLAERLEAGPPLDVAHRLRVLADVAEALGCAHRAGIVHRDVKPGNVLLDGQGRAKLTDFGIARLTAGAAAFRTQDRSIAASRDYAAPEQLTDPDAETPALDAYAFGALARRLLVGDGALDRLPADVRRALDAATGVDPAGRPDPQSLVRVLAASPAGCWPPPAAPTVSGAPAAAPEDDATGRAPGERSRPAPATTARTAEALSAPESLGWVEPPVYRPRDRVRYRRTAVLVGAAAGLVVVLVASFWLL
jgi:serine/threonine protein kinase